MTAHDVMHTQLHTVLPTDSVWLALDLMRSESIRHLLVTDDTGLVGIISNRDYRRILERMDASGTIHRVRETRVRDIMTSGPGLVTVSPSTPLSEVARAMVVKKIGCVPVVNERGRAIGMITQVDVIAALTRE